MMNGVFVVIEGPNGSGKTSVIECLRRILLQDQRRVFLTKEPTKSELGILIRTQQNYYSKESLACLVSANRYEHIETLIVPAIKNGDIVVCDRYFPSSLVYQRMDGLELSFIEAINQRILTPDLTVFLGASEDILKDRLRERDQITRFEKDQMTEIQLYQEARSYLVSKGWRTLGFDSAKDTAEKIAEEIAAEIKSIF